MTDDVDFYSGDDAMARVRHALIEPGSGKSSILSQFGPPREGHILCPFVVVADSREQIPYGLAGITYQDDDLESPSRDGCPACGFGITPPSPLDSAPIKDDRTGKPFDIAIYRTGIPLGDYSILGLPEIAIERKSLEDFYGSVGRRENFEGRLTRLQSKGYSAVVVEATQEQVLASPPPFSGLTPRNVFRTVQAWTMDFPRTHWWFMDGRVSAEVLTFRLLYRFFRKNKDRISQEFVREA